MANSTIPGLVLLVVIIARIITVNHSMNKSYNYLALGDSYTIGEQVELKLNFPNQLVALLKDRGVFFNQPQIIAQTGWTTDELQTAINQAKLKGHYDLVSLLIGVNNQYRGRTVDEYIPEFECLLQQAIRLAGNNADRVIVLSIPDWGATPFARGRDIKQIAKDIDEYNSANERISAKYRVRYVDITQSTRDSATDTSFLALDGLHPSAKEYTVWAKKLVEVLQERR